MFLTDDESLVLFSTYIRIPHRCQVSCLHIPFDVQYVPMRMIRILDSANVVVIIGKS